MFTFSDFSAKERENGFTILLLAETDESKALDALDQAIALVLKQIRIKHIVIWKPNGAQQPRMLLSSHLKVRITYIVSNHGSGLVWFLVELRAAIPGSNLGFVRIA